ncbi:putative transferase [Helianthus anomalus]
MKDDSYYGSYMNVLDYGSMMQVLKGVALDYRETLKFVINMDQSSNKLVGEIPEALIVLEALMGLNLSHNHFSGSIPKNIGNLKSLNSLDLSTNELTGTIPQSMAALNFLSYLNLSHNNFSGQIPIGNQLQTLSDPSIYADNIYLCGAPLPTKCSPHENKTSKKKYENANEPKNVWFYVDITCGFTTGFWGIIGVLLWKKQWRDKVSCFVR